MQKCVTSCQLQLMVLTQHPTLCIRYKTKKIDWLLAIQVSNSKYPLSTSTYFQPWVIITVLLHDDAVKHELSLGWCVQVQLGGSDM